jgi:hypothetical protein
VSILNAQGSSVLVCNTKNGTQHTKKSFVVLIINILEAEFFVKNTLKWYLSTRKRYNNTTKKPKRRT